MPDISFIGISEVELKNQYSQSARVKTPEFILSDAIYFRTTKRPSRLNIFKCVVLTSDKNLPFPTIFALLMLIFCTLFFCECRNNTAMVVIYRERIKVFGKKSEL